MVTNGEAGHQVLEICVRISNTNGKGGNDHHVNSANAYPSPNRTKVE